MQEPHTARRTRERRVLSLALWGLGMLVGACGDGAPAAPRIDELCFDGDGDGYGRGCAPGDDCNDHDPAIHEGCAECARPAAGCACEAGTDAVDCVVSVEQISATSLLCSAGKRYCRDGAWTECSGLTQFELTSEDALARSKSVYKRNDAVRKAMDAAVTSCVDEGCCSVCEPSCFLVEDDLTDGVSPDSGLILRDGGGVSVETNPLDAATPEPPDGCPYPNDSDCDGVPDDWDEYPDGAPFETDYDTIFMQLGPGTSATTTQSVRFFLNEADIYFLVDMTASMVDERTRLIRDLTSGNFLTGEAASEDCVDNPAIPAASVNDRKSQGIAGNISCLVRDAYLGAGWFRDVPFAEDNRRGGNDPFFMFGNEQDLTPDVPAVLEGIQRFQTVGNTDWPEGHMYALHALATGEQVYAGWDHPGIPPRRGCPDGTWGWPCFREDAVPVVILISDASMTNGPRLTRDYYGDGLGTLSFDGRWPLNLTSGDWDAAKQGTEKRYVAIYPYDNETTRSAVDLSQLESAGGIPFGSFHDKLVTFTGDTAGMSTDIPSDSLGCGADFAQGADAAFRFSLSSRQEVTLSAQGTRFDAEMILMAGTNVTQSVEMASGNDVVADAWRMHAGAPLDARFNKRVTGSTAGFDGEFPWSSFGGCESGGSETAPDAVFRFTPSSTGTVNFQAGGAGAPMALALFEGVPAAPQTMSLPNDASMDRAGSFATNLVADGSYHRLEAGSTTTAALGPDYSAELFSAVGCEVSGSPADAVIDFTVQNDGTTVEILSGGANLEGGASFAHAIALIDRTGVTSSPSPTLSPILGAPNAESVVTPIDEADFTDGWLQLTDVLSAVKGDDYDQDEVGGAAANACGATPGAHDDAWDSVYEFTITEPRLVEIDTEGSTFDTRLSLHEGDVGCAGGAAVGPQEITLVDGQNDVHDDHDTPYDLGVLDAVPTMTVHGTTDRGDLHGDYTGGNRDALECGPNNEEFNLAKDVVFQFTLASAQRLSFRLDSDRDPLAIGIFRRLDSNSSFDRLECEDDGSGPLSLREEDYAAGTYYVIVKAGSPEERGWIFNRWWEEDGDDYDLLIENHTASAAGTDCGNPHDGGSVTATPGSSYDEDSDAYDLEDLFGVTGLQVSGNNATATFGASGADPSSCGSGGREQWFRFTVSRDTTLNFSNSGRTNGGMDVTLSVFENGTRSRDQLGCDENSGNNPSNAADLTVDVRAGRTYYLLFQGINQYGDWTIDVNDTLNGGSGGVVACSGATGGTPSRIVRQLQPGTYYVVVSAAAANTGGAYTLNLREGVAAGGLGGDLLACDQDGAGVNQGRLTRTLDAGEYSVIIRGAADAEEGSYGVTIRDTAAADVTTAVACHGAQTDAGTSSFSYDVNQGQTYYLVLRGEEAADAGNYTLDVWNAEAGSLSPTFTECVTGSADGQPETRRTLNAGDYYVVLKGHDAGDEGIYQLTVGNRNQQSTLQMNPPKYLGTDGTGMTDGVLKALNDRDVRVLSVLSGYSSTTHDEEGYDQMKTLSRATHAVDRDDQPLTYRIGHDGSGMGEEIVRAVQELVGSLEMDLTVVLNQGPTPPPAPGFTFTLRATDPGTNYGCDGVIDSPTLGDADSIPDTHLSCVPGATPAFDVTFENPEGNPVERNAADPNGGYHMQLDLIGDGTYHLASIPVYIIPEDPPESELDDPATATFQEDKEATGCIATEGPDWSGLRWTADLPENTQLTWRMCTAESAAGLDDCQMRTLATVTSDGTACTADANCTNGFCQAGRCQYARSPEGECNRDTDCGTRGVCLTGTGQCAWTGLPIDPHPALTPGMQGLRHARLAVELQSTPDQLAAPTIYDYQLRYECTPFE